MKKRNKKKKRRLFNNTYLIKSIKKSDKLLDKDKEKIEISLLDNISESSKQKLSNNSDKNSIKDEKFLNEQSKIKKSNDHKEEKVKQTRIFEKELPRHSNNKKSESILNKSWKAIKGIFENKEEKVNNYENLLTDNPVNQSNVNIAKRTKKPGRITRPCQIGVYVKEVSKERLALISQIERKKKSEIIEMLLKDYQTKHYPNMKLKNND